VSVDDEGRSPPQIGPGRRTRGIRTLGRPSVRVDDLDSGDDLGRLLVPGLIGEKSSVYKHRVEFGGDKCQGHRLHPGPIFRAQGVVRVEIAVLQHFPFSGPAIFEKSQLVIAEQGHRAELTGKIENSIGIGSSIDEVAQQNDAIGRLWRNSGEELGEFVMATVDVANGYEPALHGVKLRIARCGSPLKLSRILPDPAFARMFMTWIAAGRGRMTSETLRKIASVRPPRR